MNDRRARMQQTATTPPDAPAWGPDASAGWAASVDYREGTLDAIGDVLLETARLQAGQQVLEVGSGAGALALKMARAIGSAGHVVGVDISPELNAIAQRRAAGLRNVRFVTADAQSVDLPRHSFDRLVSRFGVMFFADPAAALRHLHGLLRSGSSLHVAVWDDVTRNPWADLVLRACRDHLDLPPRQARPTGAFAFSDAGVFHDLLVECGFRDVTIQHWRELVKAGSADQSTHAVARALLPPGRVTTLFRQLSSTAQDALIADIADRLAPHATPDGVHLQAAAHIVRAIA